MYLKLSLVDELFIIKNFSLMGAEQPLPESLVIKLYNKTSGSTYTKIMEITETAKVPRELLIDPKAVYASIYIDNRLTKSYVKVNVVQSEVKTSYKLTYTSSHGYKITSNTFLKRYTLSMPAWSSAYKNDISLYSKLLQPLLLIPERIFYKTNEYLWNNLRFESNNTRKLLGGSSVMSLLNKETGEYVPQSFIKQKEVINKISLSELRYKKVKLITAEKHDEVFPITLGGSFNNLFIEADKETFVAIKGLDAYGNFLDEYYYVNDVCLVTSLIKYKKILQISNTTENTNLTVRNYCPCDNTANTFRTRYSVVGTVTKTKMIEMPKYVYNEDTLSLNSFHKENLVATGDLEDSYKIPSMLGYSKFFVTDQEDLVVLKDNKLHVGLLRKNLETSMPLYPSNNNNSLVSLLTDDAHSDNLVEFQISTKEIIEDYGNVSVKIRINSNKGTLYLNDDNDWVKDPVNKFLNNKNPIYIELDTTDYEYISVEMEFNSIVYQASIRRDTIDLQQFDIELDDMLHDGDSLIGIKDNRYYKINLEKDYFEIVGKSDLTYSKYEESRFKIISLKGNK